jgi:hypothetical protein
MVTEDGKRKRNEDARAGSLSLSLRRPAASFPLQRTARLDRLAPLEHLALDRAESLCQSVS